MLKKYNSSLIFKSGIASIDQIILSAINFTISLFFITQSSKLEFGYYSIAFSILLIFVSIQNAIVNAPLAVLLVTKKGDERKQYAGSLCIGQFMAIIPLIFLSFLIMALLKYSGVDFNKILISGAVAISLAGLLFREFLRGYFFADENPLKVIKMDALYAGLITLFSLITYMIFEIKTFIIFILIGLSAFIAAFLFFKNQKWTYDQNSIKKCYGENWRFGKWALLGVLVTHTQNYSYVYLLGAMLGSVAVADVSAARFLLMPLILVEAGWGKIAIPHGSKLREQEKFNALLKLQITASLIFTVGIAFYVTLLLTFFDVLEAYLLTDKYTASRQYIIYWGVIFAIRFLTLNASYGLQITKNFDLISKVNFLTMLITVGCAYLFINSYGIRGGLVALIIGGLLLAVALWFYFSKILISIIKGRAGSGIKKDFAFKLQK